MRGGMMTPGDYATLTEEMEHLGTQDYMGAKSWRGINDDDDENHYPFPLVRLSSFFLPLPS
jgi:glycogen(starch) synthase